jgi:hypothetical protein
MAGHWLSCSRASGSSPPTEVYRRRSARGSSICPVRPCCRDWSTPISIWSSTLARRSQALREQFLVGHRPIDPATGSATPAAGQVRVSVDEAVAALDPARWEFVVAEDRPRAMAGTGVDAVIRARRLS